MFANFKAGSILRKISQWNNEVVWLSQQGTIWNKLLQQSLLSNILAPGDLYQNESHALHKDVFIVPASKI